MSKIKATIEAQNKSGKKALTIFLTAGFPNQKLFLETAKAVLDSGADLLEIGVPFSDSLADGPVIQASYLMAMKSTGISSVFRSVEKIRSFSNIPIILMSSANPIYKYGINDFLKNAENCGTDGLIVPDIPFEEYAEFYFGLNTKLDRILLTTPTSSLLRIKAIDELSEGFVYCVSFSGTTGKKTAFDSKIIGNLSRTYQKVSHNRMQIGFGISSPADIQKVKPYCDGIIAGSAIIRMQLEGESVFKISKFVRILKGAC